MQLGRAAFWIAVYLGLVLTPLFVLLVGATDTKAGFWWDFAIALGFAGTAMMGVQFLLTVRFKRAMAPCGIDIVYYSIAISRSWLSASSWRIRPYWCPTSQRFSVS